MPWERDPDMIWLRDVPAEYGLKLDKIYELLQPGPHGEPPALTGYKFADDERKTWLSRKEIERVLQPRAVNQQQANRPAPPQE